MNPTAAHPRLPLVLAATRRALDDAARLLPPGVVLENAVTDAIARRHFHGVHRVGESTDVFLHDLGVVATVRRTLAPSGRKAWLPIDVRPLKSKTKGE
jgi:hypothetical protein